MYQYGVFKYVPSTNVQINVPIGSVEICPIKQCLYLGSNKECSNIHVPLSNVYLITEKESVTVPGIEPRLSAPQVAILASRPRHLAHKLLLYQEYRTCWHNR